MIGQMSSTGIRVKGRTSYAEEQLGVIVRQSSQLAILLLY